jgi:hypothetical protein
MSLRLLLPLLLLAAAPVHAEPQVFSLSPEAREAAIEAASRQPERNPLLLGQAPEAAAQDRRIHGEIGFTLGTGGTRSVFGTTMVPLGNDASAAFSFSTGRFPTPWGSGGCLTPPYCR